MSEPVLLAQGAEARVYTCKWLGLNVIVKHRFSKLYRHPELDKSITQGRTKAEARGLTRCRMAGIKVPALYDVNLHANEIILEEIENSVQVRNYIGKQINNTQVLLSLAEVIGKILAKLHDNDIIHGDLTTSNMLIIPDSAEKSIYLIDFGLSSISDQEEDKAVDLYVLERAILSTHPNCKSFVETLLHSYSVNCVKKGKEIIERLNEVRLRGRKKLCFG